MKLAATLTATALAALAIAGCASTSTSHVAGTAPATAATAAATPAAAPAASPDGTYTGSCDVSLSDSVNGQNYLTADINLRNTGNVGTINRVRVEWGQQGFAPITRTRTVRLRYHSSRTVHLHYPATTEQVSRFQDVQLAAGNGDGCHYHAANTGTFGPAH